MCRSIKTLANFEPPATDEEIRAAAIQFVRKLSGASRPSRANEPVFDRAIEEVTAAASRLIHELTITAQPRNREIEARKAQERARERYAQPPRAASTADEGYARPSLVVASTADRSSAS